MRCLCQRGLRPRLDHPGGHYGFPGQIVHFYHQVAARIGKSVFFNKITEKRIRAGQAVVIAETDFMRALVTHQMVALGLIGGLPMILMALMIGATMALVSSIISDWYFSLNYDNRRFRYA